MIPAVVGWKVTDQVVESPGASGEIEFTGIVNWGLDRLLATWILAVGPDPAFLRVNASVC